MSSINSQKGLSLLEVMIAITVFAVFITAYMTSEGYNLADSSMMKKELVLEKLCKNKLQEIKLKPPQFTESITLTPQTGNFEEVGYADYEYSIEYKRLSLPDFNQLQGASGGDDESGDGGGDTDDGGGDGEGGSSGGGGGGSQSGGPEAAIQKQIYSSLKKNIEEALWQIRVTVKEKGTDFPYSLSAILRNTKAKLILNF